MGLFGDLFQGVVEGLLGDGAPGVRRTGNGCAACSRCGEFRAESPGSLWCVCGHDLSQHGEAYRDSIRRENSD